MCTRGCNVATAQSIIFLLIQWPGVNYSAYTSVQLPHLKTLFKIMYFKTFARILSLKRLCVGLISYTSYLSPRLLNPKHHCWVEWIEPLIMHLLMPLLEKLTVALFELSACLSTVFGIRVSTNSKTVSLSASRTATLPPFFCCKINILIKSWSSIDNTFLCVCLFLCVSILFAWER